MKLLTVLGLEPAAHKTCEGYLSCARLVGLLKSGPGNTQRFPSHHRHGDAPKAAGAEGHEAEGLSLHSMHSYIPCALPGAGGTWMCI